jgi:hypothetical protein
VVSIVPIKSTDCSELCNIFDELTLDTIGVTKHAINGGVLAPTPPVDTLSGCEDAMETRELFPVQGGRFILEFKDEPIWLLALDTHCVEEIWVPRFSSLAHMGKHISGAVPSRANVFNRAVTRIGRRQFLFGSTPPSANVVLVCRSLPFCEAVASGHDGLMLLAIQTSFSSTQRWKWRQTNPLVKWHKVRHVVFRGPTTFQGFVGTKGIFDFRPLTTTLRRTAGHYIDYKETGDGTPPAGTPPLSLESLIPCHTSQVVVTYPSPWVRGSLLTRRLTPKELAAVYGLPGWSYDLVELSAFPCFPMQILTAAVHSLLTSRSPVVSRDPRAIGEPSELVCDLLGAPLPLDWINEALITEKAVKADDADVPSGIWDQRILLALRRGTPAALTSIRRWILGLQCRKLWLEARAHLALQFGNDWLPRFLSLRDRCRPISRPGGGGGGARRRGSRGRGSTPTPRRRPTPMQPSTSSHSRVVSGGRH